MKNILYRFVEDQTQGPSKFGTFLRRFADNSVGKISLIDFAYDFCFVC